MKAIYPGTFDPFSLGHLDLVHRAVEMYSDVVVAVSESQHKSPMFSLEERVHMAKLALKDVKNVVVEGFGGLLVDFMQQRNIRYVLRGIRGMVDFEYEFQMAQVNRAMLPGFEPVFLMPSEKYMVLSSSIIRELARLDGDLSGFLPPQVYTYLKSLKK